MYCFIINNNKVYKYQIFYDKTKLCELRNEITERNLVKVHKKETTEDILLIKNDSKRIIDNFEYKKVGSIQNEQWKYEDIFECEFDEYITPYLINIIDGLLVDDKKYIRELFNEGILKELECNKTLAYYYSLIRSMISYKVIKAIDLSKVNEVLDFYELNINKEEKDIIKYLRKE